MRPAFETIEAKKKAIAEAVNQIGLVEAGGKSIKLENVHFGEIDPRAHVNYLDQKETRLKNGTYGTGVYADAYVTEAGKTTKERVKIGTLPIPNAFGAYIVDGGVFTVDSQLRLKPGAYLRRKNNGEIETFINSDGFAGARATIDPATLKLTFGIGQANINALAMLHAVGVSEKEQRELLGKEIYEANVKNLKLHDQYSRLSAHLKSETPLKPEDVPQFLTAQLNRTKMDPKVMNITLGKPYANLNADALKAIVKKTIDGSRGKAEFDDRDALAFKHVYSVENFIKDRLNKRTLTYDLKSALIKDRPIKEVVNSTLLDKYVKPLFTSSSISEFASRDNPLQALSGVRKVTSTGEGGIENEHAITRDTQAFRTSQTYFIDPLDTPLSGKAGVAMKFASGVKIMNGEPKVQFINRAGKTEWHSPIEVFDKYVLLPGDPAPDGTVAAAHRDHQVQVPKSKIDLRPIHEHYAFSETSLIVPGLHHDNANRGNMANNQLRQATSLKHREAPLVQSKTNDQWGTYENAVGTMTALRASDDLKVLSVDPGKIQVQMLKSGEKKVYQLHHNDVATNKAYFHNEIEHLKPGMVFKKGEVISDSNFTKGGTLALSANMNVAYMPWHGLNMEDGIVVSESGAKQLTSQHMTPHDFQVNNGVTIMGKKQFVAAFPSKYSRALLEKYDESGMPKKGATINPGEPLYLKIDRATNTKEDLVLGKVHKSLVRPFRDTSEVYEGAHPATVIDSFLGRTFGKVNIRYDAPAQIGDKLANRHGAKGVISAIVPDDEMPHTKNGERTDVILSPMGVITRMSMGQILETAASKIAHKTGIPYLIENFNSKVDYADQIKKDLDKHGLSDQEELIDPKTGHSYGKVLFGKPSISKLYKLAHGNLSARELGAYDVDHLPLSGKIGEAKSIDQLTLYALLGHGHRNLLNEIATIKGDANPQYWQHLQMGLPLPKPTTPFAYKKFEALLAAAGVNVRQDGTKKILSPMTDHDTKHLSGDAVIQNVNMLDHKGEPVKGGLFDMHLTGGSSGQKWSRIELPHSVPNPHFESAIKRLTGITDKTFKGLLNHSEHIDGKTGHEAFHSLLSSIDVHKELDATKEEFETAKSVSKRDKALKRLKLLKALDFLKLKPQDAYMMKSIPVLPPVFRPVIELPNGSAQASSLNTLYRDAGLTADAIKHHGNSGSLYSTLYQSVGAIQGKMDPVSPQARSKQAKGAVEIIAGDTPKTGFFQGKVVRKTQDVSGRATIALDNNLNMDEISIPRKVAHTMFRPFATRTLVGQGYTVKDAHKHIDEESKVGKLAIEHEMVNRPVMMNRAPTLHRFGIMSFKAKTNDSESVLLPGLVVGPFGADFDGDTVMLHVPVGEKARQEALQMLPSNNLFDTRRRATHYAPQHEAIYGLHILSKTEEGRKQVNSIVPAGISQIHSESVGKDFDKIFEEIAKKAPEKYNEVVTKLKQIGDRASTMAGYTLSLSDLKAAGSDDPKKLYQKAKTIDQMMKVDQQILAGVRRDKENNLVKSVAAGARGGDEQLKQILYAPGIMQDHNGRNIPRPVTGNYGRGMNFADYVTTIYGARKGSLDKTKSTASPGALSKEIVNASMDLVISDDDCHTKHGLWMKSSDPYVLGRYEVNGKLVTKESIHGRDKIMVRSPQTCESSHGICKKCYGHTESGNLPSIGRNVGVISAQAVGEPLTQAAMKTFHLGGTATGGGGVFGVFETVENFLQAPSTFRNRSVMAKKPGRIDQIKPGAAGGHHVMINGEDHFIHPNSGSLKVKAGDSVELGQSLNEGIPHPVEAIDLLGHVKGGQVVVDSLADIYKRGGLKVDQRNIETVVRGLTGFAQINNPGSHKTLAPGDVVRLSKVSAFNMEADKPKMVKVEDAHGMILSKPIAGFKAGTVIGAKHLDALAHHKEILAHSAPIEYKRVYVGSDKTAERHGDWVANFNFRHIKRGLENGALHASQTDVHGYHPIAPFITGELREADEKGHY